MDEKQIILEVEDLQVSFDTYAGEVKAVRGVSFQVREGETLAIVGESGSGKSVTSQAVMRLVPDDQIRYKKGIVRFEGRELLSVPEEGSGEKAFLVSQKEMEHIRGAKIGMILQDPLTSLNPTMLVGRQIAEGLLKHQNMNKTEAIRRSIELLELVGIPEAKQRACQYPHEFSGGMRQRVSIAIALACNPKLLIADEPTTALDVTIQAQILELMKELQKKLGTSIILITHDLGIVADMADWIVIMYAGRLVEKGSCQDVFYRPGHPYTWGLLQSVPDLSGDSKEALDCIPGTPPDLHRDIQGCPFKNRCKYAMKICYEKEPETFMLEEGHTVGCWLYHQYGPTVKNPITGGECKINE
ncbi:MAG: ABC transporter ATP-binding protein [Lachnospiraceae bacterium]|nr:ABC transporter ATP-binding protein [Lachnospiraceae bacterium]